jgi:16S rRNA (guanine527-N7)-methyltransferase
VTAATEDPVEALCEEAREVGVALGRAEAEALWRYGALLCAAPGAPTGVRDPAGVRRLHLLDALVAVPRLGAAAGARLLDLGSGVGVPGIPLALVRPDLGVALVEASARRAAFLRGVVATLGLGARVQVVARRAEELGRDPAWREGAAVVVARAVASLRVLAELGLPLCAVGGRLLAWKGPRWAEEVREAERALRVLGGVVEGVDAVRLPGGAGRALVALRKVAPTPPEFPRRVGVPARRPL